MSARFSGSVALVTGGTGGLGRSVSRAFLEEGANVIVTYLRHEDLALLKQEAGEEESRLDGREVDVTDEAAARGLVESVVARHGSLDVLVNTVGGYGTNRKAMPKADFGKWPKPEDIARVVLFLCSDEARVVHGAAIPVYGNG